MWTATKDKVNAHQHENLKMSWWWHILKWKGSKLIKEKGSTLVIYI